MINTKNILSIVALAIGFVSAGQKRRHRGGDSNAPKGSVGEYELYIFSAELPGSVCSQKHCKDDMLGSLPAKGLNMHGLWPQNMDGKYFLPFYWF